MRRLLILGLILLNSCTNNFVINPSSSSAPVSVKPSGNTTTPRDNKNVTPELIEKLSKITDVVKAEKRINSPCDAVLYLNQNTNPDPVQAEANNIAPFVAICIERVK